VSQPHMSEDGGRPQEQELRLSVSDKEVLQKEGFRADERGPKSRRSHARFAQMKLPQAELRTRRHKPDAPRLAARHAPHPARVLAHRRRHHRYSSAGPGSTSRRRSWRCSIYPVR